MRGGHLKSRRHTSIVGSVLLIALMVPAVEAASPNGWCFPADACMGMQSKVDDGVWSTCESQCRIADPVAVRDMQATLYDRTCGGDWGSETDRVMFLSIGDQASEERVLMISDAGVTELEPCDL